MLFNYKLLTSDWHLFCYKLISGANKMYNNTVDIKLRGKHTRRKRMIHQKRFQSKSWVLLLTGMFLVLLTMGTPLYAEEGSASLEQRIKTLEEELEYMSKRVDKTELHAATDKLSFGVELRSRVDSLHYTDVYRAPSWLQDGFLGEFNETNYNTLMTAFGTGDFTALRDLMAPGMPVADFQTMVMNIMYTPDGVQMLLPVIGGFSGVTQAQAQTLMGMMAQAQIPAEKYDADNDMIFTNRLRLEIKSKISSNLDFGGRLAMNKVFGDSSGNKFMTGSLGDVNMDGNTSSLPHGDTVHVERAYFNYKFNAGPMPANVSFGRRPATNGPPLEYGDYGLEGGSPMASIINWQFDGASLSFGLEDLTGIPGSAFKLCYGVGFESDWGNSYSLNGTSYVDDATFGGFIASLYDDGLTSAELNYAHAWDITDGFAGTVVMPFIPFKNSDGTYTFTPNTGSYISRMQAMTNIGDFDMLSLVFRTNFSELFADIDFFIAPSWSKTDPKKVSRNPYYELMGMSLVSTADAQGNLEGQDGYSVYAGMLFPMPFNARLGLEYNWGSEYWLNMTGAEDSLVASKLSTRGQVYEVYYIQPVVKRNFFLKLGGCSYDYEYTGSGNPLGAPVKIDDITAMDAFFPVVDTAWNVYLSATLRY